MTFVITILFLLIFVILVVGQGLRGQWKTLMKRRECVQALFQKRSNLIPLLIETVREYTQAEEELIAKLIAARDRMMHDGFRSDYEVGKLVESLITHAEKYDAMQKDTAFLEARTLLRNIAQDLREKTAEYNLTAASYNAARVKWYARVPAFLFRAREASMA